MATTKIPEHIKPFVVNYDEVVKREKTGKTFYELAKKHMVKTGDKNLSKNIDTYLYGKQ